MKSLQLIQLHKEQLRKMIEILFPDYRTECQGVSKFFIIYHKDEHKEFKQDIHWFEFCITYLSEKIFFDSMFTSDKSGDTPMESYLKFCKNTITFYSNGNEYPVNARHPIEYLYKKFKML